MNKLFFLLFITILISIKSQTNNTQQPNNNQSNQNVQSNNSNNMPNNHPPPQIPNNNLTNQDINLNSTNILNKTNNTDKPGKEFNLTESLIKFFNEMFGSNKTNNTNNDTKTEEQKKIEEEKRKEEQRKREQLEKIRMEAERKQKEREMQRKKQLEKEREEFEKQVENVTISEFTNLYLEAKSGELLYHNLTKPCNLKIIFFLIDTEKTIHLTFNGPNGRGHNTLIKSFRSKSFLYYEYNAQHIGQYTFYLNNYHNSDETEVLFAIIDDSKTNDNLEKKNIDKISGYLNDIDSKINQMKAKQNIINKKTKTHNESINKHNREILIYSIVEVVTMLLVFVMQTCYIKNMVEKL